MDRGLTPFPDLNIHFNMSNFKMTPRLWGCTINSENPGYAYERISSVMR